MRINIVTIFPEFFVGPLSLSIPKRAQGAGLVVLPECVSSGWLDDPAAVRPLAEPGDGSGPALSAWREAAREGVLSRTTANDQHVEQVRQLYRRGQDERAVALGFSCGFAHCCAAPPKPATVRNH